jgi:hypothetical protein
MWNGQRFVRIYCSEFRLFFNKSFCVARYVRPWREVCIPVHMSILQLTVAVRESHCYGTESSAFTRL